MIIVKKIFRNNLSYLLKLTLILIVLQSCNVYKNSTSLEHAATANEEGYLKVTMLNGDEYIYESIEFVEDKFYGVKTVNEETIKTILLKEEVKEVQRQNKKSSSSIGFTGIAIGVGSIILGVLMFGS